MKERVRLVVKHQLRYRYAMALVEEGKLVSMTASAP
jgi:hypothetical protein